MVPQAFQAEFSSGTRQALPKGICSLPLPIPILILSLNTNNNINLSLSRTYLVYFSQFSSYQMSQLSEKMHILWILLWWASICHAAYNPGYEAACLDKNDWKMPAWHLPTNSFIESFTELNRPWRQSLIKRLIENKALPANIVLPDPLLPTEDPEILKLYTEAIGVLVEDEATPASEKRLAQDRFAQDTACWNLEVECQGSGWMLTWPWWSCRIAKEAKLLFNWYSPQSLELDDLTKLLLKRAYRYALLDLSHQLAPLIKHIGYYPLEKRIHTDPDEPIPELVIPKFAQNVEILVRFYTDPVHRADHHDVREPHLPGHIVPPKPLLSTVSAVFNRTDKTFINLYRDALKAYDEDQLLGDSEIRQRWQQHLDDSWDWIVTDPCYYDRNSCNIYDYFNRIFSGTWFQGHEAAGAGLKKAMEHQGLANLGVQLILEAMQSKGSRRDLQRLLSEYWDE